MRRAIYEDDVIKLLNRGWKSGVYPLGCDVRALPSAQPETHEKRTETHACDLISRQAAIDAVEKESQVDGAYGYMDTKSIADLLNALPPAEPDHIAEDSKKVSFAQGQENDSISRQAAIDEATRLFEMGDCYCDRASIVGMLNSLPPAQPEQKWTPCSDPSDLPKDDRLWITREIYGARIVYDVVWDMTEWSDDVSGVVAYMPYWEPEPYAEGWKE